MRNRKQLRECHEQQRRRACLTAPSDEEVRRAILSIPRHFSYSYVSASTAENPSFSTGTSVTPTWGVATTAGNLAVVSLHFSASLPTITPPAGFQLLASANNAGNCSVAIYAQPNTTHATTHGTFSWSGSVTVSTCELEYSGFGTTLAVDQSNSSQGSISGGSAPTGNITTGSQTTVVLFANTLVTKNTGSTGLPSGYTNRAGVNTSGFSTDAGDTLNLAGGTNTNANMTGITGSTVYAACIVSIPGSPAGNPVRTPAIIYPREVFELPDWEV